jgi:hypothetical protein
MAIVVVANAVAGAVTIVVRIGSIDFDAQRLPTLQNAKY